jgi:hypothetical protein
MTTPIGAVAGNAQATQRDAGRREVKGGSFWTKKYGPLPGWGWSLLAGGGALAYFWWRSRGKSGLTGTAISGTGTGTGYAGQLASLQDEIAALQGQHGTTNTTGTGTATKKAKNPVKGLKVDSTGFTSVNVSWEATTDATQYRVHTIPAGGKRSKQVVTGTTCRLGDLKRATSYKVAVWAMPGTVGTEATVSAKTK